MKKLKGILILLLVALIWGVAFVAQDKAGDVIGAFTFNASRNFLAVAFLGIFLLKRKSHGQLPPASKQLWLGGFWIGLVLFIAESFQQSAIASYPATAAVSGRSGFLASTYVIFVAVMAWIVGRNRNFLTAVAVVLSICGMYFLCLTRGLNEIYFGDILNVASAFFFALHILVIDRYRRLDSLMISCLQFVVAGSLALLCALVFDSLTWANFLEALVPIIYAGVISSGVGYTLQIVGQKYADPASSALVLSLESVFAALAGFILLGEVLTGREFFGGILVFLAVICAQIPDILMIYRNQKNMPR